MVDLEQKRGTLTTPHARMISIRQIFLVILGLIGMVYAVMITRTLRTKAARDALIGEFWGRDTNSFETISAIRSYLSSTLSSAFAQTSHAEGTLQSDEEPEIYQAGLVSSVNYLELTRKTANHISGIYDIRLTKEPRAAVTMHVVDPTGCTITSPRIVVFTPTDWMKMRPFRTYLQNPNDIPKECGAGIIHVLKSDDLEFDKLHVRIRLIGLDVEQLSTRPDHTATTLGRAKRENAIEKADGKSRAVSTPRPLSDTTGNGREPEELLPNDVEGNDFNSESDAEYEHESNERNWQINATIDLKPMDGRQFLSS